MAPFKSDAQKKKFEKMLKDGQIRKETFDAWEKDTPKKLPKRVGDKKKGKK